jgi:hypothetical protein
MGLPRTFIIATVIALTGLATVGFGNVRGDSGLREDASARQNIVLTAVTADAAPLSDDLLPQGPIPCPDGSTVDFGQFCPLPTIQCANGTTVPIGQFCPSTPATTATQTPPPPVTCPDGSTVPQGQNCPTPKPPPPPPPTSTLYQCGAGYHYDRGFCVANGPVIN